MNVLSLRPNVTMNTTHHLDSGVIICWDRDGEWPGRASLKNPIR